MIDNDRTAKGRFRLKAESNTTKEHPHDETADRDLIRSFALRQRLTEASGPEQRAEDASKAITKDSSRASAVELIEAAQLEEFLSRTVAAFSSFEQREILERAINYLNTTDGETLEVSFIGLYSSLESTLTFFRHEGRYKIFARDEFAQFERDLKKWLRQHPLLQHDSARRGLVYEKIRELNRLPFNHVFQKFCDYYALELDDLWPVSGRPSEWPLAEIRHRLVHGDAFISRPVEAIACAREHLRWTVERMLLAVLGWPIAKTRVSREYLSAACEGHRNWPAERAKFA